MTARLEAFLKVCRGVQHAHSRGFLHRDLKPSNILVAFEDGACVPKVIDFGVARILDEEHDITRLTGPGQVVGTLGYMSPEQMQAGHPDVDVRADIYSLGVVLYELLAGRLPFECELFQQPLLESVRAASQQAKPCPPSQLRMLTGAHLSQSRDLDCIVLKAMQSDRELRYPGVRELMADVERVMSMQPITARPPSRAYLLRRFAARHRVAIGILTILILTLGLGVTGTTIGLIREHERVVELQAKDAELTQALHDAEAVASYLGRVSLQLEPRRMGPDVKLRDALLKTMRQAEERQDRPFVRGRFAAAVGEALYRIGDYRTARQILEKAHRDLGTPISVTSRTISVNVLQMLAGLSSLDNGTEAAERYLADAFALLDTEPRAEATVYAATVRMRHGRFPAAVRVLGRALQYASERGAPAIALASHRSAMALALIKTGDHQQAIAIGRKAVAELSTLPRADLQFVQAELFLGLAHLNAGNHAKAEAILGRGRQQAKTTLKAGNYYRLYLETYWQLARERQGAEGALQGLLAAAKHAASQPMRLFDRLGFRMLALQARSRHDDPLAGPAIDKLLATAANHPHASPIDLALLRYEAATAFAKNNPKRARQLYEQAYAVLAKAAGKPYSNLRNIATDIAELYRQAGNAKEAEQWSERAGKVEVNPTRQLTATLIANGFHRLGCPVRLAACHRQLDESLLQPPAAHLDDLALQTTDQVAEFRPGRP